MTTMEPRVAERRRGVSEDKARRRLRWILGIIGLIAAVGFGFWIVRSPVLSISSITVSGAELSNPQTVIDEMGVIVGVPTIDVDRNAIGRAIESDPWAARGFVNALVVVPLALSSR